MVQEGFVPGFPVITFEEKVPEFNQGYIPDTGTGQEFLYSLIGRLDLDPCPEPSPVRPETDIDDGFDPFGQENFQEILRVPAAVPDGIKSHG